MVLPEPEFAKKDWAITPGLLPKPFDINRLYHSDYEVEIPHQRPWEKGLALSPPVQSERPDQGCPTRGKDYVKNGPATTSILVNRQGKTQPIGEGESSGIELLWFRVSAEETVYFCFPQLMMTNQESSHFSLSSPAKIRYSPFFSASEA